MAKKGYFSVKNFTRRELPSGYTQVLYIESSGSQYLDTGFKPNQDTRVVLDFQVTAENSDLSANVVFGARSSASSKAFAVQWNTSNDNFQHFYNNGYDNLDFGKFDIRQIVEMNKNVFSLNGETHTRTYASFQCAYALYLFALNNAGTVAFYSKMRMYSCQIYDNGTLVRDFVPCYRDSDHAVGLYDMVQGTFYTNAGTGAFTCPLPLVELPQGYTQVAYIEATGTQYINTGFVANQDTSVTIDFEVTDTTATSWLFCGRKSSSADAYGVYAYKGGTSFYFMYGTERNNFAGDTTKRQICKVIKNQCSIGETTVTVAEQTFSSSVPLCLLVRNTNGTIETFATAKVYSCQIYDNGTLIRDYVPCLNVSGAAGLYDMVNGVFYGNAGTGSFAFGESLQESVAREAKKVYFSDNGVARLAKKAYYGDENGKARLWYTSDVPIGTLPVGTTVYIGSSTKKYLIVHQGLPSSAYDSSCDGTWLLCQDHYVLSDYTWDSYNEEEGEGPYNDYENSLIHTMLNYGGIGVSSALVKQVKIPYRPGYGTSKTVASGANGLSTKFFLLSYTELGFSGNSYAPVEGAVLDYFADATDSNFKRVFDPFKKGNGEGVDWWLRTPDTSGSNQAWRVGYFYNSGKYLYGRADREIVDSDIPFFRPAFILPSNTLVDENFNVIA